MAAVVHYEFLKSGETITATRYCDQLDKVNRKLSEKQPALVNRKGVLLLHDNAPAHTAKVTLEKLKTLSYETVPHPPYSPDLSPSDYHTFRSLANFLKGKSFKKAEEVKTAFADFVSSRDSAFFKAGMNDLRQRWEKVVDHHGSYFDE